VPGFLAFLATNSHNGLTVAYALIWLALLVYPPGGLSRVWPISTGVA
jgi:hypothetical protein